MRAINQNPAGSREGGCGSGRRCDGFTARPSRQQHVSINEAAACFRSERTLIARTPSVSGHLETAPSGQRARSARQRPATTAARLGMNGVIRRMASRQHKSRKFSISPNSRLEALYICPHCGIASSQQACMHPTSQQQTRSTPAQFSSKGRWDDTGTLRCAPKTQSSTRTLMQGLAWLSSLSARTITSCNRVRMM